MNSGNHDKTKTFGTKNRAFDLDVDKFYPCYFCRFVNEINVTDLNAFCCVGLQSRDAKSMLNVATFVKTAVATIGRRKSCDTISSVKLNVGGHFLYRYKYLSLQIKFCSYVFQGNIAPNSGKQCPSFDMYLETI